MKKQDERFNDDTASKAYTDAHRVGRNLLINGDFGVWQRGTSFPARPSSGSGYVADRWLQGGAVNLCACARNHDPVMGSTLAFTNVTPAHPIGYITQMIELGTTGHNEFQDENLTFSFYIKGVANADHDMGFQFRDGAAGVATQCQITDKKTEQVGQYTKCTGKVITKGLAIDPACTVLHAKLAFLPTITSAKIVIAMAQVERGEAVTPFDHRPIGLELALCQRYFFRYNPTGDVNSGFSTHSSTATLALRVNILSFSETMRVPPTLNNVSGVNGGLETGWKTSFSTLNNCILFVGTVETNNITGRVHTLQFDLDAEF